MVFTKLISAEKLSANASSPEILFGGLDKQKGLAVAMTAIALKHSQIQCTHNI